MERGEPITIEHPISVRGGKYVELPAWIDGEVGWANLAHPNPHAKSSEGDTIQLYPVGSHFHDGDRDFFYGYISSVVTGNKANIGIFNISESATDTGTLTWGATAGVKGDTVVGVLASGLTDTAPAENDFAGGWLLPRTNPYSSYRVVKSSVSGKTTSGEVDLTIAYGLIEAVSASQGSCFLNFSEWTALRSEWAAGSDLMTCPGVTLIDPIASTWQWVQSWGPCYVVPYNEEIGATVGNHDCFFHIDGTIKLETRAAGALHQRAGYMLNSSSSSTTSTWLIRLMVNK